MPNNNRGRGLSEAIRLIAVFRSRDMTQEDANRALGRSLDHTRKLCAALHGIGAIHVGEVKRTRTGESPIYRYGQGVSKTRSNGRPFSSRACLDRTGLYRKAWAFLQALEAAPAAGVTSRDMFRATGVWPICAKVALEEAVDVGMAYRVKVIKRPHSDVVWYGPAAPGIEPPATVYSGSHTARATAVEKQRHDRTMQRIADAPKSVFDLPAAKHAPNPKRTAEAMPRVSSVFALGDQYRDAA